MSNTGNSLFDALSGVDMYKAEFKSKTDLFEGETRDPSYGVPDFNSPAEVRAGIIKEHDRRLEEHDDDYPMDKKYKSGADALFEGEDVKFFYEQYTVSDDAEEFARTMGDIFKKTREDRAGLLHERFSTDREGNFIVLLAWWETTKKKTDEKVAEPILDRVEGKNVHEIDEDPLP